LLAGLLHSARELDASLGDVDVPGVAVLAGDGALCQNLLSYLTRRLKQGGPH
jgi:hypothetical protein